MGPWPVADVERALKLVQGFDPTGVAARDLQECLLLAASSPRARRGRPTEKVVTEHLRPAAEPSGAGESRASSE
jgi:RNA polymerase sigma-54 factor